MQFLARESGAVQRYSLPMLAKEAAFMTGCRPQMVRPNCDGTRLLVADMHGALAMFDARPDDDVEAGKEVDGTARRMEFHRKVHTCTHAHMHVHTTPHSPSLAVRQDVWDICWAEDDPEQFATMEKTRMYMFRRTEPEEPVLRCVHEMGGHAAWTHPSSTRPSSAYICQFKDLSVTSAQVDEILQQPDTPQACVPAPAPGRTARG